MNRDTTRVLTTIAAGIAAVVGMAVLIFAVAYPDTAKRSGLGAEFLLADLSDAGSRLQDLTGFRPLADAALFAGSYVLVSLSIWTQAQARHYLRIRKHFQ